MAVWTIDVENQSFQVEVRHVGSSYATVLVDGKSYDVGIRRPSSTGRIQALGTQSASPEDPEPIQQEQPETGAVTPGMVKSPLPGMILAIPVKKGELVKTGDTVIKIEAMKMENQIRAHATGRVQEIYVQKGETVLEGANLMLIG